jgi:hypothetical protein
MRKLSQKNGHIGWQLSLKSIRYFLWVIERHINPIKALFEITDDVLKVVRHKIHIPYLAVNPPQDHHIEHKVSNLVHNFLLEIVYRTICNSAQVLLTFN